MSIALDIGTQHFRSLRREGGRLVGRKNHAVYIALPDQPGQRRLLEKANIRFAQCDGAFLIIGQAALETAEMLQTPCIPLLADSKMPQNDPVARQVMMSLIECLIPPADVPGETCWTTIPGANDSVDSPERQFFTQLIRLKGYEPRFVPAGLAVAIAELGQNAFTGLGCDFGAGFTRFSFAYHGVAECSAGLAKGGNWIDSRIAESEGCILWDAEGNRYLNTTAIQRWRHANLISVIKPITEREQRLSLLCEELIAETLILAEHRMRASKTVLSLQQPIPVVCSGGLSRLPGFCELMLEMIRDARLPVEVSEVRRCTDPDYTVTRGHLILAELDETSIPQVA